jgi:hypothetical protein|nr:MAG TPA: hypothetical protein [Caudoviricetes sp.]
MKLNLKDRFRSPWCEMHRGLFRSDWFRMIPISHLPVLYILVEICAFSVIRNYRALIFITNFIAKFIVKIAINIWQYQKKDVFLQR